MARDDGETIGLFEPLMIPEGSRHRSLLSDLALDLTAKSASFVSSLPPAMAASLAELVRSMNCYYSNLIEGHNTHPIDIERALVDDYSTNPEKRNLQLEAKAHITVQKWIDEGGLQTHPTSPAALSEIHRRFVELLPPELLMVKNPATDKEIAVIPGAWRETDVKVGRHIAISPGAVPRFLDRMHQAYRMAGRVESILAAACAHHRFLWVHPFIDGNGRVARLVSYAILRESLDTRGLWSVARGLARRESVYKQHLAGCDLPRRNDMDGRGSLSEEQLAKFTAFFLETAIDQVSFMESLMKPQTLRERILYWAEEQIRLDKLPVKSDIVLKALLYEGQLERGAVASLLGTSDRTARRITSALVQSGALSSESTRAPLTLAFPAKFADRWMPGLFPEKD